MLQVPAKRSQTIVVTLVLIAAAAVMLRVLLASSIFPGDDALMTFRVARNVAAGNGFVYNLGENVYCTTAALYALVLAALGVLLKSSPIDLYLGLGVLLSVLNLASMYFVGSCGGKAHLRGLTVALLFSLSWNYLTSTLLGMETPLFLFLFLGSVAAAIVADSRTGAERKWKILSGVCAGLAAVTRPEGLILAFALVVHRLLVSRKIPWTEILAISAAYLPWCLFAALKFGTIIPQSVPAKALGYYRAPGQAVGGMTRHFFELFVASGWAIRWREPILGVLLLLGAAGVRSGLKSYPATRILFLFNLVFIALYASTNPLLFDWYLVPLEPGYILAVAFGFWFVIEQIKPAKLVSPLIALTLVVLIWLSLMTQYVLTPFVKQDQSQVGAGFLTVAQNDNPRTGRLRPLLSSDYREKLYQKIAADFDREITDQTRIMAPEFGALGYFSRAKFISSLGHVNPEVMPFLPPRPEELGSSNNVITLRQVQGLRPDYIICYEIFIEKTLLTSNWFDQHYSLAASHPVKIWNTPRLYVFTKRK